MLREFIIFCLSSGIIDEPTASKQLAAADYAQDLIDRASACELDTQKAIALIDSIINP